MHSVMVMNDEMNKSSCYSMNKDCKPHYHNNPNVLHTCRGKIVYKHCTYISYFIIPELCIGRIHHDDKLDLGVGDITVHFVVLCGVEQTEVKFSWIVGALAGRRNFLFDHVQTRVHGVVKFQFVLGWYCTNVQRIIL